MTREEQLRVTEICELLQTEKDQHKFTALCAELNKLLDAKSNRLENEPSKAP